MGLEEQSRMLWVHTLPKSQHKYELYRYHQYVQIPRVYIFNKEAQYLNDAPLTVHFVFKTLSGS